MTRPQCTPIYLPKRAGIADPCDPEKEQVGIGGGWVDCRGWWYERKISCNWYILSLFNKLAFISAWSDISVWLVDTRKFLFNISVYDGWSHRHRKSMGLCQQTTPGCSVEDCKLFLEKSKIKDSSGGNHCLGSRIHLKTFGRECCTVVWGQKRHIKWITLSVLKRHYMDAWSSHQLKQPDIIQPCLFVSGWNQIWKCYSVNPSDSLLHHRSGHPLHLYVHWQHEIILYFL